jgi:twitching motility protein PilT
MQVTVEDLLSQIEKLQLMPAKDLDAMKGRWFRPGRQEVRDATRFCDWLRVNDYMTEFVISVLARGKADWLILNQYRLTDLLRTGAQAGDYSATDPLDRVLRVQIVSHGAGQGPAWYEKFRLLVQRLMNVHHPGVARVLDLGQARGVDYVVSEFVDGESLEEVLKKRGKLTWALAARIFAIVFDAVGALHQSGVGSGEMSAEHLIFASADKSTGTKTVRLVNAGFPPHFFDSSALGIGEPPAERPRRPPGASDGASLDAPLQPEEDILHLGSILYRSITGHESGARGPESGLKGRGALSARQAVPEIPSMLADLLDSLVDPVPANRPKSAAGVAKSLRVLLKTEEEASLARVEEKVIVPVSSHGAPALGAEVTEDKSSGVSYDSGQRDDETSRPPDLPPMAQDDWRLSVGVEGEPEINKLFRLVMQYEGSDLHLAAGLPPMARIRNVIRHLGPKPIEYDELEKLVQPILTERSRELLEEMGGADFAHRLGQGEGRFRVNLFKQRGHLGIVARRVNTKIPNFEQLHLPPVMEKLCQYDQGMVILAGVTGSGKSTTLAAMLDYINHREQVHILTIEDPIEYLFTSKRAVINQREVGIDVHDWNVALKHAVRQDPDVILVGEMRDRETFEAGLNAAETGHLVFCTIHASSAPSTISRILDLFPADMHQAMRQSLAFNLKAIICQKLLPSIKPGAQRVPANEIMIVNPTIRELLIKAEDKKLPDAIRIGYIEGMVDFSESLRQLVARGDVDEAAAIEVAPNPDALKMALKGIKVSQPGIL